MKIHLCLIYSILLLTACNNKSGSGNIISETKNVADFHGISASQGFEVDITSGSKPGIIIEADDNLMKYVTTRVENGILKISINQNNLTDATLKAHVSAINLDELSASSGAEITSNDVLENDRHIKLQASSGGSVKINLISPEVKASVSSGSNIDIKGRTRFLTATVSSGASLDAFDLLSERTKVNASSAGQAYVHSSVDLTASASSGGSVKYKGSPTTTISQSSGGGVSKED